MVNPTIRNELMDYMTQVYGGGEQEQQAAPVVPEIGTPISAAEVPNPTPTPPTTPTPAAFGTPYDEYISKYASAHGVDPADIYAIGAAESNWNPDAVSPTGVRGVMQVTRATAAKHGVTDRENPESSIRAGTAEYAELLQYYNGDKTLALMAYNGGRGAVNRWIKNGKPASGEGLGKTAQKRKEVLEYPGRVRSKMGKESLNPPIPVETETSNEASPEFTTDYIDYMNSHPAEEGEGIFDFAKKLYKNIQSGYLATGANKAWEFMFPQLGLDKWQRQNKEIEMRKMADYTPQEAKKYIEEGIVPKAIQEQQDTKRMMEEEYYANSGGRIRTMGRYIANNPEEFIKGLGWAIAADPWLLGLGSVGKGVFAGLTEAGVGAKAAATSGAIAEGAVAGGVIGGGEALVSARESLTGEPDWERAATAGGAAAGLGLLLGSAQAYHAAVSRSAALLSNKANLNPSEVEAAIYDYAIVNKISIPEAMERVLAHKGENSSEFVKEFNTITNELMEKITDSNHVPIDLTPRSRPMVNPVTSMADELWATHIYRPNNGSLQDPVISLNEFIELGFGKSKTGKPLQGAALQSKYRKYNKQIQLLNRDEGQVVTKAELEDIISEANPEMRKFFLKAAKKRGARGTHPTLKRAEQYGKYYSEGVRRPTRGGMLGEPLKLGKRGEGTIEVGNTRYRPVAGELGKEITRIPKRQRGGIDPKLLALLGTGGVAALVGYAKENDSLAAVKWAIAATGSLAAGQWLLKAITNKSPTMKTLLSTKKKINFTNFISRYQGEGAVFERRVRANQQALRDATGGKVKGRITREKMSDYLETGNRHNLTPQEIALAEAVAKDFKSIGERLKSEGIIDLVIENYVPHFWAHQTKSSSELLEQMFSTNRGGIATHTIHEKDRVIPTLRHGLAQGLTPRTLDLADIWAMYAKSVDKSMRANEMFYSLKGTRIPGDTSHIIEKGDTAPQYYRSISHPRFNGYKVHPDAVEPIRAFYGSKDFSAAARAGLSLNFWLKRMAVSVSGFHAKALLFSNLMANKISTKITHPLKSSKEFIDLLNGRSKALEMLMDVSDTPTSREIDRGIRNGLMLNLIDDVGGDTFYNSLSDMQVALNRIGDSMPIFKPITWVGKQAVRGIENLNKITDTIMWDHIFTHYKLTTYLEKMASLTRKYGNKVDLDELSAMAAEFTNDAYGGLNWIRLAENVQNKYLSKQAYRAASPAGRAGMQFMLFAPDWTTANMRVAYRSLYNKSPIQKKLYQAYMARGLLMWVVGGDALNYSLTGHHIWENKDPTTIELGDGRSLVLSKQFMEPYKWVTAPQQSAVNKLSSAAHIAGEVLTGKQWLAGPGAYAPPIESYPTHFAKKFSPIWAQQGMEHGPEAAVAGLVGFPIKGQEGKYKGYNRSKARRESSRNKYINR